MNNNILAERLNVQPLTEEEKQQRHILGRLFGPIATCLESTRNGRKYNRTLWERALSDEIFNEKVANKCLFLELGHPADREEIDMTKVCACIPEMPKIIDGDLCASVDILDTPNGKILKTLCDYGFVPGISSRGSGDVLDNDEVDPETFFLECFDIVAIPAVKKARLSMCESLDTDNIKLKNALVESYKSATEEDRTIMKDTLENLNINIEEELMAKEAIEEEAPKRRLTAEDIPWAPDEEETLVEDAEEKSDEVGEIVESEEVDETTEEATNETDDEYDEVLSEEDEIDGELDTISDTVELFKGYEQEYGADTKVEFQPIEIDGVEYTVDKLDTFVEEDDETEEKTLVIGVDCKTSEEETEDTADEDIDSELEEEEISEEESEETEESEDSADDDGDVEVIESLKDMIRQKEALETEVSDLRKAKAVGDAKEQELQEKLNRYRQAFKQTSTEAAKVSELQAKVKELNEQLTQSKTTIKTLTEKVNNAQQLKESIDANKVKVNRLNEEVTRLTKHSEALEAKLEDQTKQYTKKLHERTDLAKTYKARFIETLTKYVESKANMLGVQSSEITSRLNESYTLSDVDAVCDQILDSTVNFSRLPFSGRTKTSARISESVNIKTVRDPEYGYEIDDSLLELAGLKK